MRAVKVQPKEFLTEIASANQKLEKWESGRPFKGQAFPLYAVSKVIYQKRNQRNQYLTRQPWS